MWQLIRGMKAAKTGTILLTGATAGMRGGAHFSCLSPGEDIEEPKSVWIKLFILMILVMLLLAIAKLESVLAERIACIVHRPRNMGISYPIQQHPN